MPVAAAVMPRTLSDNATDMEIIAESEKISHTTSLVRHPFICSVNSDFVARRILWFSCLFMRKLYHKSEA
jgi:hypothetical protein